MEREAQGLGLYPRAGDPVRKPVEFRRHPPQNRSGSSDWRAAETTLLDSPVFETGTTHAHGFWDVHLAAEIRTRPSTDKTDAYTGSRCEAEKGAPRTAVHSRPLGTRDNRGERAIEIEEEHERTAPVVCAEDAVPNGSGSARHRSTSRRRAASVSSRPAQR